jgi:hypothetical protein
MDVQAPMFLWLVAGEGTSLENKQQNRGYQHQAWGKTLGLQSAKSSKHSSTMFGYIILFSHK